MMVDGGNRESNFITVRIASRPHRQSVARILGHVSSGLTRLMVLRSESPILGRGVRQADFCTFSSCKRTESTFSGYTIFRLLIMHLLGLYARW